MNKENRQIYDRNIRLWGNKTQELISKSKVLLINLSSVAISEVAKNLILSGVNLILYDEKELVQRKDTQVNFFFCNDDINKNKSEILRNKLLAINPLVTIGICTIDDLSNKSNGTIQFAVCDTQAILYSPIELLLKESKIITYYIDIQAHNGYFINNIEIPFKRQLVKVKKMGGGYIALDDDDEEEDDKSDKGQTVQIVNEEVLIADDSEDDILMFEERIKRKMTKDDLVYCTLMEKFRLINKQSRALNIKNIDENANHWLYLSKYLFSIQENRQTLLCQIIEGDDFYDNFFAISCVIAGLVSLEVIKVISMSELPNCNLYSYDCEAEQGEFLHFSV